MQEVLALRQHDNTIQDGYDFIYQYIFGSRANAAGIPYGSDYAHRRHCGCSGVENLIDKAIIFIVQDDQPGCTVSIQPKLIGHECVAEKRFIQPLNGTARCECLNGGVDAPDGSAPCALFPQVHNAPMTEPAGVDEQGREQWRQTAATIGYSSTWSAY